MLHTQIAIVLMILSIITHAQYTIRPSMIYMIRNLGRCAFQGKLHVKSEFRLLPEHPSDHNLLGFKFSNELWGKFADFFNGLSLQKQVLILLIIIWMISYLQAGI